MADKCVCCCGKHAHYNWCKPNTKHSSTNTGRVHLHARPAFPVTRQSWDTAVGEGAEELREAGGAGMRGDRRRESKQRKLRSQNEGDQKRKGTVTPRHGGMSSILFYFFLHASRRDREGHTLGLHDRFEVVMFGMTHWQNDGISNEVWIFSCISPPFPI